MVLDGLETAYLDELECRAIGAYGAEQAALMFSGGWDEEGGEVLWSGWGVVYGEDGVETLSELAEGDDPVPFHGCIARNGRPIHVDAPVLLTTVIEEEEQGRPCGRFLFHGLQEPEVAGRPGIA